MVVKNLLTPSQCRPALKAQCAFAVNIFFTSGDFVNLHFVYS
jgi:hypothetical protein